MFVCFNIDIFSYRFLPNYQDYEFLNKQDKQVPLKHPCSFDDCPRNRNPYVYEKARNNHEVKVHGYKRNQQEPDTIAPDTVADEKSSSTKKDGIYSYQRALLAINLLLRNINDAIREGDGERLLVSYKMALLYFKSTGHTKYAYSVIKLMYQIKYKPQDAFRLIWGRFVNTHGFIGRNIPNDLHLEHLNGYLKELLRSLRGNFNESNCSRVARALNNTKIIVENFEKTLLIESQRSFGNTPKSFNDIKKLTEELYKAQVFQKKENRHYESYQDFNENVFLGLEETIYPWIKEREFKKAFANTM